MLPHSGHVRASALDVAAMMTAQIRRFAVHDEPGAAPRATGLPAARRAEERERESAPVDEDQRLLAAIEPRRERRQQRRADAFDGSCVAVADEPEVGQARRNHRAPRQLEPAVAAPLRVNQGLERRRCAAQHHGDVALPRAPDRDVAAVIANALLLLERRIVLFVDDDERRAAAAARRRRVEYRGRDPHSRSPPRTSCAGARPAGSRLCNVTVRWLGNASAMRWPNCGVRLISGTRISTCPPAAMHAAAAARYTSVLPLPVTPCSRKGANDPAASMMARRGALLIGIERHGGRSRECPPRRSSRAADAPSARAAFCREIAASGGSICASARPSGSW